MALLGCRQEGNLLEIGAADPARLGGIAIILPHLTAGIKRKGLHPLPYSFIFI
jgi:hypothetical protein